MMLKTYSQQKVHVLVRNRRKHGAFFRSLISKIIICSMLVFISIFRVLLVSHVNIMSIFVSVINSKSGMERDYKNPLLHPARAEMYSEVPKMAKHNS